MVTRLWINARLWSGCGQIQDAPRKMFASIRPRVWSAVIASLWMLSAVSGWARIGETLERCTARYGPAERKHENGNHTYSSHRWKGVQIHIYYEQGKATSISVEAPAKDGDQFVVRDLTEKEILMILKTQSDAKRWQEVEPKSLFVGLDARQWDTTDGSITVVYHEDMRSLHIGRGPAITKQVARVEPTDENLENQESSRGLINELSWMAKVEGDWFPVWLHNDSPVRTGIQLGFRRKFSFILEPRERRTLRVLKGTRVFAFQEGGEGSWVRCLVFSPGTEQEGRGKLLRPMLNAIRIEAPMVYGADLVKLDQKTGRLFLDGHVWLRQGNAVVDGRGDQQSSIELDPGTGHATARGSFELYQLLPVGPRANPLD